MLPLSDLCDLAAIRVAIGNVEGILNACMPSICSGQPEGYQPLREGNVS